MPEARSVPRIRAAGCTLLMREVTIPVPHALSRMYEEELIGKETKIGSLRAIFAMDKVELLAILS